MNVVFSVCKRDNKTIFVLVSDGLLSHYIFLYFYFYFQLVHPRGCRIYLRSKVSNIMNINKHSKGLRLCGRGLENYLQKSGDVSWHVVKLTEPMVRYGFIFRWYYWLAAAHACNSSEGTRNQTKSLNLRYKEKINVFMLLPDYLLFWLKLNYYWYPEIKLNNTFEMKVVFSWFSPVFNRNIWS